MGSFFSMLRGSPGGNSTNVPRSSKDSDTPTQLGKQFHGFILDLKEGNGATSDQKAFPEFTKVLQRSPELLERLRLYQDSASEIRKAITEPTTENEAAAWKKLTPSIILLKECYEYAKDVEEIVPVILERLCGSSNEQAIENVNNNRGLARTFAYIMQNAFEFDTLKSSIPVIQNDFSYYRRTLSRMPRSQDPEPQICIISNDVSNHMSLFYAYHNPLVKTIVDAATNYANNAGSTRHILECVAALAIGSYNAIKQNKMEKAEDTQLCIQVLVTCCILYDWMSPHGIVDPQSPIDHKSVLQLICDRPLANNRSAQEVLRFNCKTMR